MYNDYHSLGYEGITVNLGDNLGTVRSYARFYSYLFLLDADSSTWNLYRQNDLIPLNYVIDNDPDQTIVFWMEGFNETILRAYIEQCLTGIEEGETGSRQQVTSNRLFQNYPSPFVHTTTIPYQVAGHRLPVARNGQLETGNLQPVSLNIYDLSGRLVRTLVDGPKEPGYHRIVWDGRDSSGREVGSGVCFYRLTVGGYSACKKVAVLR